MQVEKTLSVSELNRYIKEKFDKDLLLQKVALFGELSNVKCHTSSGHWYFSLKDDKSALSAVMFKSSADRLTFRPENGKAVVLIGKISVYEKTGSYQIYVERMLPQGEGDLQRRFEALKEKLKKEGVFKSEAQKRTLCAYPRHIVLVTSPTGAVIRDMVTTLKRRAPFVNLTLIPANVQGALGVASIVSALEKAYQLMPDAIIVGRGGGSIEDLWAFNEEAVVRKISLSPVPIISAVGHETDTTLSDYAADWRAGTPSIAAEMVAKDSKSTELFLNAQFEALKKALLKVISLKENKLAFVLKDSVFYKPELLLQSKAQALDEAEMALDEAFKRHYEKKRETFLRMVARLEDLNPLLVLKRGYLYGENKAGVLLKSVEDVTLGDEVRLYLQDGCLKLRVEDREKRK